MADVKVEGQYGFPQQPTPVAAPVANAAPAKPHYIQKPPTWVIVIRGIQIFLSIVILGIAGYLMHGKVLDENAFALVCAIFTWIVVGYTLVTEKVTSANEAYNIWAVMALDLFMAILWLASMASNAALRGKFNARVRVTGCYNTGSTFNSSYCSVYRRLLGKRGNEGAIASDTGLDLIATIAGLSALVWILFIVTLVYHGHTFRMWHAANKAANPQPAAPAPVAAPAQAYAQPAPVQYQQGAPVQFQQTAPAPAPAYNAQSYPQQTGVPAQFAPSPVGTPAPQQPFQAPQQYGYPNPAQQQYVQPTQSPAPGQPYYPPTQ